MPAKCFAFQTSVLFPAPEVHCSLYPKASSPKTKENPLSPLTGNADLLLHYWELHKHTKSSVVFFCLRSRIEAYRVFNCFLAESVINKPPKASAQITTPAKPEGSLKVMRGVNCLIHFSSLQQSRYKLFKRNALKSFPWRGFLLIHVHDKRVTDLILTMRRQLFSL